MKRCSKKLLKKVDSALIKSFFDTINCYKDLFFDYGKLCNMIDTLNEILYPEEIEFHLESETEDSIVLRSDDVKGLTILITPVEYEIFINRLPA
ncbi:MAG: hypothetical protein LIR50_04745 [Bacillota bacterium]|nr:hypothetical protein [Bacillota bacterium]